MTQQRRRGLAAILVALFAFELFLLPLAILALGVHADTNGLLGPILNYLFVRFAEILSDNLARFVLFLCLMAPPLLVGLLTCWGLMRPSSLPDGYLRCLGCGHILKGLTEPRCPECGERI